MSDATGEAAPGPVGETAVQLGEIDRTPRWVELASLADLHKKRKLPVVVEERQILLISHEGELFAFDNLCIHRERELTKGVILNGKLVCPGHQWAFQLASGWEAVKEQSQPTYDVRAEGDAVLVDLASHRARAEDGS